MDFEGETDFPEKGEFVLRDQGQRGTAQAEHTFQKAGTYFAVVRVKSQRQGNKKDVFTQVKNIDRVRVIVE